MKTKIQKLVSVKNANGNYRSFPKEFNNEQHFNNWYDKVHRNGGKVIGMFDITNSTL